MEQLPQPEITYDDVRLAFQEHSEARHSLQSLEFALQLSRGEVSEADVEAAHARVLAAEESIANMPQPIVDRAIDEVRKKVRKRGEVDRETLIFALQSTGCHSQDPKYYFLQSV